jgi:hypothetical protein
VKKGCGVKYAESLKNEKHILGTKLIYSTKEEDETVLDLDGIDEGVGDVYAEKKFGIPDSNKEFEKKFNTQKAEANGLQYGNIKGTPIYKNPKSLDGFEEDIRAIGDIDGNIYVAVGNGSFIHSEMAVALRFTRDSNEFYNKMNQYLLLVRIDNGDEFGLSSSSDDNIQGGENSEKYKKSGEYIIRKLKQRNPQYGFHLENYLDVMRNQLNENKGNGISYSAVVLDDKSHTKLVDVFANSIPDGWKTIAHHMTLNMGTIDPQFVDDLGKTVKLTVTDFGIDDYVLAVGVKGYSTTNNKPHVTIAVNTKKGGKPVMSNKLTNWRPIQFGFELDGVVSEIAKSGNLNESTKKKSKYKDCRELLDKSKNISKDMKQLITKYLSSGSKYVSGGKVFGLRKPKELTDKSNKVKGLGFGADKKGFFIYTHRARTKSKPTPSDITMEQIEFIDSTS